MTTRISTKLAAVGLALMMNGALFGGIAILFDGHLGTSAASLAAA